MADIHLSAYYMDKYETTQTQYLAVMGTNPSNFSGVANGPVEMVTWYNAIEYCNRKSIAEGLLPCYRYGSYSTDPVSWPSGWNTSDANHTNIVCDWTANGYRLPTEMERIYASMGGSLTHNYTYSGSNNIDVVAWYAINSGSTTHAVGTKAPNELGIYDMTGNVREWVWDIYGGLPAGSFTDPRGAASGPNRLYPGGNYSMSDLPTLMFERVNSVPTQVGSGRGFRVCRNDLKRVADPVASIGEGTYTTPLTISLSSCTYGASIRYTLDGSQPTTTHGTLYSAPIAIDHSLTLKAIAYLDGRQPSDVVTVNYIIIVKVATPQLLPAGGYHTSEQIISISCSTTGALVYYTIDGSEPTTGSILY